MTSTSRDRFYEGLTNLIENNLLKCPITPEEIMGMLTLMCHQLAVGLIEVEDVEEDDDDEEEYPKEFPGDWDYQEPES